MQASSVSSGHLFGIAVGTDGSASGWGLNDFGQIGDRQGAGTTQANSAPVVFADRVTASSSGTYHAVLLGHDGRVRTLGRNSAGQLGVGTNAGTTNPNPVPSVVEGITEAIAISAGDEHTLVLRRDGTVWSFGSNGFGQLGRLTADATTATPERIQGLSDIIGIAAGYRHSLALRADGTVWSWGYNRYGELGRSIGAGSLLSFRTPAQVPGLAGITQISAGLDFSLVLRNDGVALGFGANYLGQLTDPFTSGSFSANPTPIPLALPGRVIALSAGGSHAAAILDNRDVMAWGWNPTGQLGGLPTATDTPNPTPRRVINIGEGSRPEPRTHLLADSRDCGGN